MQQRHRLPLSSVIVLDRQREIDLDYVTKELMPSIAEKGLIQPIVVNQENRLIAGGHRLESCRRLGHTEIDVVYRETLSEDELQELELEENVKRKNLSWQQECIAVAKIHGLKRRKEILAGNTKWGQRETGRLLGVEGSTVNYALKLAAELSDPTSICWSCDNASEAWKLIMRRNEDVALAELAKRQAITKEETSKKLAAEVKSLPSPTATNALDDVDQRLRDILTHDGYETYVREVAATPYLYRRVLEYAVRGGLPAEEFDAMWQKKLETVNAEVVIPISSRYFHTDSIKHMLSPECKEKYDHIITDIPYGIDMDMLDQQKSINELDTVTDAHDVDYNLKLIADFFPAAYHCTRPDSFTITWCDQMLWQYMYDHATAAGFKVQRWPITWLKTHNCMNQSAQYNFTKNTEIAIVCRKGKATLVSPQSGCVISAGRDELCAKLRHPFAKPYAVWAFLTMAVSIENQLILEPFMGRGSGVISMLRLNRQVHGCELEPHHYNAFLEVIKSHYLELNERSVFS